MALPYSRSGFRSRFAAAMRSPLGWSLVVLWLLLIAMETARPCYFLHDDNAAWFIGAYLHDFRVLLETGRLAEVNYFQHGGEPFLEEGQTAVLYPPVYLGEALARVFSGDARWAIEWIAAEHLTLGLIGFYCWMRQGGVPGVPGVLAVLGGLAWVLNPFVLIVGASWIMATYVVAWLPWMFWAFDRLLARPSASSALFLGASVSLLFLQGYVQWFAYAVLFLGVYALLQFVLRREARKPAIFYYLFISALIFTILSLPLLLPMLHAVKASAERADALPADAALFYSIVPKDVAVAQLGHFQDNFAFGVSTVIFYSPALLFLPVMIFRLFYAGTERRLRLFSLVFLALLALVLSSRWHAALSVLPFFDKFRWPFKVFLLADFFLIASLVGAAASWAESRPSSRRRANLTANFCLGAVIFASLTAALVSHDDNTFSTWVLPSSVNPLPRGLDPRLGRVATFADDPYNSLNDRSFSLAYATYFAFPSLGGYNPLVREAQLEYALYLDYPNVCSGKITPDFQKTFEARSVRYWIVDPRSSQLAEMEGLSGLRLIERSADRVVFEDTQAEPLVHSTSTPSVPCLFTYSGNSLLIPLHGTSSPLSVSAGPTDGWWYRVDQGPWHDRGPWQKAVAQDYRLIIPFTNSAHVLEVTYFDARFRLGLYLSAGLLILLGGLLAAERLPLFQAAPGRRADTPPA